MRSIHALHPRKWHLCGWIERFSHKGLRYLPWKAKSHKRPVIGKSKAYNGIELAVECDPQRVDSSPLLRSCGEGPRRDSRAAQLRAPSRLSLVALSACARRAHLREFAARCAGGLSEDFCRAAVVHLRGQCTPSFFPLLPSPLSPPSFFPPGFLVRTQLQGLPRRRNTAERPSSGCALAARLCVRYLRALSFDAPHKVR